MIEVAKLKLSCKVAVVMCENGRFLKLKYFCLLTPTIIVSRKRLHHQLVKQQVNLLIIHMVFKLCLKLKINRFTSFLILGGCQEKHYLNITQFGRVDSV
jgi:hypothetical protein